MNLYSASISKAGKHINLTFVSGQGDDRVFGHCPIAIGEGNRKASIETIDGVDYAVIKIALGKPNASNDAIIVREIKTAKKPDDDIPF